MPYNIPHHIYEEGGDCYFAAPFWEVSCVGGSNAKTVPWTQDGPEVQVHIDHRDKLVMLDDSTWSACVLWLNPKKKDPAGKGMHILKLPFDGIKCSQPIEISLKRSETTEGVNIKFTRHQVTAKQWERIKVVMGYT